MLNLNADIIPALRYVRLNITERENGLNRTINDIVAGNDTNHTIYTSMQGPFAGEEKS